LFNVEVNTVAHEPLVEVNNVAHEPLVEVNTVAYEPLVRLRDQLAKLHEKQIS
jgi:hypothetical protein